MDSVEALVKELRASWRCKDRIDYWSIPGFRDAALAYAKAIQRKEKRRRFFNGLAPYSHRGRSMSSLRASLSGGQSR